MFNLVIFYIEEREKKIFDRERDIKNECFCCMLKDELIWVSVWEVILVFKVFEFYFLKCLFVSYECLYGKDIFMYIMIGKYNLFIKLKFEYKFFNFV